MEAEAQRVRHELMVFRRRQFLLIFTCCVGIAGSACENNKQQTPGAMRPADYSLLTIDFEQARITVFAGENFIRYTSWQIRDSAAKDNSGRVYHLPINEKTHKANLAKHERDSLFCWLDKMITRPPRPTNFCTDYVGYVRLMEKSAQVERSCTYSSICEWEAFSVETKKINKLIKSKFSDF